MTGPAKPSPRRRTSDNGWRGSVIAWWRAYGQLFMGAWLLIVSLIVLWVAIRFQQSQAATEHAAQVNCERSRIYGPGLADFFEREHAFPAPAIEQYRASIPKACPGSPGT